MGNRIEPRAAIRLPVIVSGTDAEGNPFKQSACVCDLSRMGARVEGIGCLRGPGEIIEVEYRGRSAKFFVMWIGLPGTQESGHIGIRKHDRNQEIWGRNLPHPQADGFVQTEIDACDGAETIRLNEADTAQYFVQEANEANSTSIAHLLQQKKLQEPEKEGDRRQYRRYAVDGGAEVRVKDSGARTWGALTDISASGCYVEMYIPYPVGTEVHTAIEIGEIKVVADGIVRVVYPGLGIGIEFAAMTDENKVRLNELLAPVREGSR